MKRVEEIKTKRQGQFILNRLKEGKRLRKEADFKEVKQNINLIKSPAAGLKQKEEAVVEIIEQPDEEMVECN